MHSTYFFISFSLFFLWTYLRLYVFMRCVGVLVGGISAIVYYSLPENTDFLSGLTMIWWWFGLHCSPRFSSIILLCKSFLFMSLTNFTIFLFYFPLHHAKLLICIEAWLPKAHGKATNIPKLEKRVYFVSFFFYFFTLRIFLICISSLKKWQNPRKLRNDPSLKFVRVPGNNSKELEIKKRKKSKPPHMLFRRWEKRTIKSEKGRKEKRKW